MLPDGGLRIGADVRNSDLAAHPVVRSRYPVLARALLSGASGQLRNLATTGGNLLQRTRCVYFQDVTTPCNKREPGTGCSAIGGYVRYHAILGASEHCVAVHPSDMAVAMAALDAEVVSSTPTASSASRSTEFHRLPGDRPDRDTDLPPGALITAVEMPPPPAGARSTTARCATARPTPSRWSRWPPNSSSTTAPSLARASRSAASRTSRGAPTAPKRP